MLFVVVVVELQNPPCPHLRLVRKYALFYNTGYCYLHAISSDYNLRLEGKKCHFDGPEGKVAGKVNFNLRSVKILTHKVIKYIYFQYEKFVLTCTFILYVDRPIFIYNT